METIFGLIGYLSIVTFSVLAGLKFIQIMDDIHKSEGDNW